MALKKAGLDLHTLLRDKLFTETVCVDFTVTLDLG